jgi:hypothetical protein
MSIQYAVTVICVGHGNLLLEFQTTHITTMLVPKVNSGRTIRTLAGQVARPSGKYGKNLNRLILNLACLLLPKPK